MKAFRAFRLVVWVGILALCVIIMLSYQVVSSTVLSKQTVQNWVKESNGYLLARDEILTPLVLDSVKAAEETQSNLVTNDEIRSAVNASFTPQALEQKVAPVIGVVSDWLNSKRPEVTFSVDVSDLKTAFFSSLHAEIVKKASALPLCTFENSVEDVANTRCRLSTVSANTMADAIVTYIQSHQDNTFGDRISQSDFSAPVSSTTIRYIPEYINYLWTLALIAAGVFVILSGILLFTRKLIGMAAIGISCVLSGGALAIGGLTVAARHFSFGEDQFVRTMSASGVKLISDEMIRLGSLTAITGLILAAIGFGAWTWWKRRK